MRNENSIKISPWPFLVIGLILVSFITGGFIWDKARTIKKIERLKEHSERIYQAHINDFIEIATLKDPEHARGLLEQINAPEQGLYITHVLRRTDSGHRIFIQYASQYANDLPLSQDQEEKINKIINDQKTTATTEALFRGVYDIWGRDNIYSFTPIVHEGKTIGFVVVQVPKAQNI